MQKMQNGANVLAVHHAMKTELVSGEHARVLGPLTPTYQSRVQSAWSAIRRMNKEANLEAWMKDPTRRLLISKYVTMNIDPPASNYMTAHETRTLSQQRSFLNFEIGQFKPGTTSSEAVMYFHALNRTPDHHQPAFCMLTDTL